MIKYTLRCENGHVFEDWFTSSSKFDELAAAHDLSCPDCNSHKVEKSVMAPNVSTAAASPAPACGASACANMGCPAMQG